MPRGKIKVQDTMEAFLTDLSGNTRYFSCMNASAISKTVDTEDIRCGIGAGLESLLYSNPDMTVTLTPAFWNEYFLEISAGEEFKTAQTISLKTYEDKTFTDNAGDAEATITGTPVGGLVQVQDKQGKKYPATFSTGTVTVTGEGGALDGQNLYVIYDEETSTADTLDFKTDSFPEIKSLTLHTIAYNTETNAIVSDIYFIFDRVLGDGALDLALALQTNSVTEITLRVLPSNGNEFGKYVTVDRA